MEEIIIKVSGLVLMIVLGFGLKKLGMFKAEDSKLVSKILLNVTLPCSLLVNFQAVTANALLLVVVFIGVAMNLFTMYLSKFLTRKEEPKRRYLFMLNTSGYNVGTFTVPVVGTFLSPLSVVTLCMFDIGNAIMTLGANYALASGELAQDQKYDVKQLVKKIFSSVPVDAYVLMLLLSVFSIRLPEPVLTIAGMIGSANTFLAMFMLGLSFDVHLSKESIHNILGILGIRYAVSIPMVFVMYFLLPFPLEMRQALAIVMLSALSVGALAFTAKEDCDIEAAGVANSISIVIGIAGMTLLMILFGV